MDSLLNLILSSEIDSYLSNLNTIAIALSEIAVHDPELFNNETPKILLKVVENCEFETTLSLCPVIRYNNKIWSWLNESTQAIIKSLLTKAEVKVLSSRCALGALSIPELKEILFERIENFDYSEKLEILSSYQHPELIEFILQVLS